MKTDGGFTLIELLVTIAVASIVLTLAVPGFRTLTQNNRITAQANELITSLNLARSEAVRRQSPVKVCVSADPDSASCNGSNWALGWLVQAGDEVLSIHPPLAGESTLTARKPVWNIAPLAALSRISIFSFASLIAKGIKSGKSRFTAPEE